MGEERQREGAVAPKPRILDHGFGYGEEERSVCPREPVVRRAAVNWEKQGGEQHFLRSCRMFWGGRKEVRQGSEHLSQVCSV